MSRSHIINMSHSSAAADHISHSHHHYGSGHSDPTAQHSHSRFTLSPNSMRAAVSHPNTSNPSTFHTPPPNNSSSSYTNASIPSTFSSLGYASEDHGSSLLVRSTPNLAHFYSPRSKGNNEADLSSGDGSYGRPYAHKSLSQDSVHHAAANGFRGGQGSARPTSLGLQSNGGVALQPTQQQQQQQCILCPNCKRKFVVGPDSFEMWFQHIKTCGVQNP